MVRLPQHFQQHPQAALRLRIVIARQRQQHPGHALAQRRPRLLLAPRYLASHSGFLQEIGPYYLEEGARYKAGDTLTANHYSWHLLSHLLFIESPAGVGYSLNTDPNFEYNDLSTANDNFAALQSFFAGFPEYSGNPFWIAGESYAGKYIPDLAVLIDYNNGAGAGKAINLKGMMIGNGVMSFLNGELEKSSIEFMIDHEFIDVDLVPYYRGSCFIDADSAGCRYFKTRYDQNVDEINPYNVYSYCFYNDSFTNGAPTRPLQSQASILRNIAANKGRYEQPGRNGAPCAFFDGLLDYFTAHAKEYHAAEGKQWNGPCVSSLRLRRRTSPASTTSTSRAP